MISRAEILMGRDKEFPLTPTLELHLNVLLMSVNNLRAMYGQPMYVSSGYRPGKYNAAAGGAPNSCHLTCEAVDFKDADGKIKAFCTPEVLEKCGLYMEAPESTPTWCHLQVRRPGSGSRIFKP